MSNVNRRSFLKGSLTSAAYAVLHADLNAAQSSTPAYTVVWDMAKAYREATPTRERICVNGLWQWQPAGAANDVVPRDGWGYLRVPERWPGGSPRGPQFIRPNSTRDKLVFYPDAGWENQDLSGVITAWQQREITIPQGWAGRRITLHVEYLNSYAVVYLDGAKVGEMRFPGGEVDLTSACRPGQKQVLSLLVMAMPLKAVMMSFGDSNAARQVAGQVQRRGNLRRCVPDEYARRRAGHGCKSGDFRARLADHVRCRPRRIRCATAATSCALASWTESGK